MPFLSPSEFSNYYMLEIFDQNINSYRKFIAESITPKTSTNHKKKGFIQGSPGTLVSSSDYRSYSYTITCHEIISYGATNFDSFLEFCLNCSQQQIEFLNTAGSISQPSYYLISNMSVTIKSDMIECTATLEFSDYLLDSYSGEYPMQLPSGRRSVINIYKYGDPYYELLDSPSRVAMFYDVRVQIDPWTIGYQKLNDLKFSIKFDYDKKTFLNSLNSFLFLLKDYSLDASFNLIDITYPNPSTAYSPGNLDGIQPTEIYFLIFNKYLHKINSFYSTILNHEKPVSSDNLISTQISLFSYFNSASRIV